VSTRFRRPAAVVRIGPIRAFEADDLPAVAGLYERTTPSGCSTPKRGPPGHLDRLLDHPWADPELPSLVYVDDAGEVAGFLESHVRRMVLEGLSLRLACCGPLVVDEAAAARAAGALLMRRFLSGPQDLTMTDRATPPVRRLWGMLGAVTVQLRSLDWTRVLRPVGLAGGVLLRERGSSRGARALRLVAAAPDALLGRTSRLATHATAYVRAEPLSAQLMLDNRTLLTTGARLYPDYDAAYLAWLFGQLETVRSRGPLIARMLRGAGGEAVGWYVAYMPAHDIAQVLQVAALPRDIGSVLDQLLCEAARRGATAVRGRLEPQLMEAVAARGCRLRHRGTTLIHSTSPEIAATAESSRALLTRLDGDSWMAPHLL